MFGEFGGFWRFGRGKSEYKLTTEEELKSLLGESLENKKRSQQRPSLKVVTK